MSRLDHYQSHSTLADAVLAQRMGAANRRVFVILDHSGVDADMPWATMDVVSAIEGGFMPGLEPSDD